MIEQFLKLQEEIYKYETTDFETGEKVEYFVDYSPKIFFSQVGDFFETIFFGDGYDDDPNTKIDEIDYSTNFAFCRFLEFISNQGIADKLISIKFSGPDEGANGTKSWNFNRLVNSDVVFPNLKSFMVQLTNLGDHNQSIIDGDCLDENGIIARLMLKMPNLERLVLPSAPDKSFFQIGKHPLKSLTIQAGYSNQNFIENLANSENFFQLSALDYTEVIDVYDIPVEDYTSFENYKKLFQSKGFSTIKHFKLRGSILETEQLFELQKLNNVQFLNIVAKGGRYVSHLMKDKK